MLDVESYVNILRLWRSFRRVVLEVQVRVGGQLNAAVGIRELQPRHHALQPITADVVTKCTS